MKPNLKTLFSLLAAIPLLLSSSAWASQTLTITNPGFEQPVVNELDYSQQPVGWSAYNVSASNIYAYNPGFEDFVDEAPEGQNVGAVYWVTGETDRGLVQTLTATFQEGDSYLLTVKVGYTEAFAPPTPTGYRVQLLAGDTVIAEDDNSQVVPAGDFVTSTVEYDYDPILHAQLINEPLKIRLLNKGLTNNENEVAFDDVKLFAVLANPFADAGGSYYLPNSTDTLNLDASASLPSGTETITLYEWDVDNDGEFDDASGATPAAISYSDLQDLYGMVDGSNTIQVRVTDSSGKTATAEGTVELVTSTKYIGQNGSKNDTWGIASNWDNGLPAGELDVVIQSGQNPMAWSDSTPTFTGNLTLQNNARLTIGWTTRRLGSYNALGTPGLSKIIMNPGSSILTRMGDSPVIPEIELRANAVFILGTSTQGTASAKFNYPIRGPYTFTLSANGTASPEFNASNTFTSLVMTGDPRNNNQPTYRASVVGSLGVGNVTINTNPGNSKAPQLWIDATHAMPPTATLFINGDGPTGNGANRLRVDANLTIASLVLNGTSLAAGTYGKSGSGAQNPVSWINTASTGILTIAAPQVGYWDINGTTAGAGGTSPNGTWDNSAASWNSTDDGTGSLAAWTPGDIAIFSAGNDATDAYDVEVVGTQDISGIIIRSGSLAINQGSGGTLRLTSNGNLSIEAGASTIATPITQNSVRALSKSGMGSLTLSGNLSHTGGTSLLNGNMTLSGNNSAATGSTTISSGTLFVDTPSSIPGTTRNVTIDSSGTLVFGSSFGSGNIQTALNNRIVTSSAGTIVADNYTSTNFDFNAASLSAAYFGALGNVNYTGTLTPQGSTYRLGGNTGTGTLTMANTNALTGGRSLTARGKVVLAAANNYTGATTVSAYSSLSLLGSTTTNGINLNTGSTLTMGNNGSLGSGTLTLSGTSILKAVGTVVTNNAVAANEDFTVSGSGTLTLGAITINNNRNISILSATNFDSITRSGTSNRNLTINNTADATISGDLVIGGTLTKNDSGTLTLQGKNTYGSTNIDSGVLRLEGSVFSAGTTTIDAARLQLGSNVNGGMASGTITINHPSARIEAVDADRVISNDIILSNNGIFTGNHSLTVNGTLTNNNGNRTLSNIITSSKALTLGDVSLSQNSSNRTLTITGSGNTVVNGVIENGGGSSSGNLIKSGSGTLILSSSNTYAGTTTVNANGGKLFVNGSTSSGSVTINSGATLGGTGTIGGNTTIAAGGLLEFNISSDAAEHDKLELASGRSLTFSGASELIITGAPSVGTYTLLTAPGGITGNAPIFNAPDGWVSTFTKVGNNLVLDITFIENTTPPPTLVSIQDDQAGGPIFLNTPVTYTVTFDQDMNLNTFSAADFSNAGTSTVTFGTITEPTPGVFTIQVTPTSEGTLRFRINQGTSLRSADGVNLNTSSALLDDTTLNVEIPTVGVLAVSSGDIMSSGFPGGPFSPTSKQYTLTNYGSESLNWTAGKTAAWLTLDNTSGTLAAGTNTTVTATINSSANSLAIESYYDSITFTNTTNDEGTTTRGVSLTVNGLPVEVTLGNLNQTYDGSPKSASVTTDPTPIPYSVTYNGFEEVPTTAGVYDVVATITDPGYSGSASGTLVIAKATQTISFAALDPIGNDETALTLTATASSGLPVSYTSSNSDVATISENTLTILDVGTTTITASQEGDENYASANDVSRDLTIIRVNPLADPGGPYEVEAPSGSLQLDGSGSLASGSEATITLYEWDLNNDNNFGDVTGATPTPISATDLLTTWGMSSGTNNTIQLRVTDSDAKTSTVSTTVYIIAPLLWDSNGANAGQTDGGGGWLNADRWWNGSSNLSWIQGEDATFGNGGSGGNISLPAPTSVGSITFSTFSGTYNIGNSALSLTINNGLTTNANSGNVSFSGPIILGAEQTWLNLTNDISFVRNSQVALDTNGHTLIIDGTGSTILKFGVISGGGGLTKNGSGYLEIGGQFGAPDHTYTGTTTLNGGRMRFTNNLAPGNIILNGGVLEQYFSGDFKQTLGTGAGQVQILGGDSGFGVGLSMKIIFNNNNNFEAVWGSSFFNPSVFVLNTPSTGGHLIFGNRLDLNGADRTIQVGAGQATQSGVIRNSSVTPAGLIKTGNGRLNLNASNTYNGGTILEQGTLQLGNVRGLGSSIGTLTVNGGLLNLNNYDAVTVGNLTGTGGTIANNGNNARTFTIGSGGGTEGNFQGVIANNTNSGSGTLALTKAGAGSITLSGTNTYSGVTQIEQGKLFINGSIAAGNVTVSGGATLGGTGSIGGDTTIAANGKLEFSLNSPANSHDPLNIASGKTLAFSGASELTINISGTAEPGTYVLVSGGNDITGIAPATLNLPSGSLGSVSIVGNELRLQISEVGDISPPTLVSIVDNQGGGSILVNTLVTYTVTFDEEINATTVSDVDFTNAGTASITIGTITNTSPGVFTVEVTPTTGGSLQLRIPTSSVIQDTSGNALVTNPALDDNTTLTVTEAPSDPYLAWSDGAGFNTDGNDDGVPNGLAWLLGATDRFVDARDSLPIPDMDNGKLVLSFYSLKPEDRGDAVFKVQFSNDLGQAALWTTNEAVIPAVSGVVGNIVFTIVDSGELIYVEAKMNVDGGKMFGRLIGTQAASE